MKERRICHDLLRTRSLPFTLLLTCCTGSRPYGVAAGMNHRALDFDETERMPGEVGEKRNPGFLVAMSLGMDCIVSRR